MSASLGIITYALNRYPSGIGQYTVRLIDALNMLGFKPAVLQSGGWPEGYQANDYNTVHLPGTGLLPALLTLGQIQIGWQTRNKRLKLVHDPTGTIPLALSGTKRVVTICDAIPYVYPETSTALDRLIHHYWLPLMVKRMDVVITISQHSKLDLEKYLNIPESKIIVTHLAAGPKFLVLTEGEIQLTLDRIGIERPYILYIGSVEPRKNLLHLLEAFQRLQQWSTNWRLVIVGATNYWRSSPVVERVKQLGLQERVKFTGYIPDEELPALYNGASLFCFPSLYEGFGLPVLEAMACGTPVVTSNTSSLPEVAGEAALLVNPNKVEDIAKAMQRILEDPAFSQDLRVRGFARAAEFTWDKTARETIAVYENVLGEKLL